MVNLLRAIFVLALMLAVMLASPAQTQDGQGGQDDEQAFDEESNQLQAKRILEDALDEHLPWWMPKGRSEPRETLLPDSTFNLRVDRGERLSLDEVVLQIRRSHDGRVVRATETDDGFVIRLLLDGGRLRTLHVSPEGEVVRAQTDE